MAQLINISQLRSDQLDNFIDTRISTATGILSTGISGSQVNTGSFDNRYVHTTGDETISGIKNFVNRPLVFNTGVLLTGQTLSPSQTGELASSGNLVATGQNLRSQIIALSGTTGTFSGVFYPLTGNPSGFSQAQVTGSSVIPIANIIGIRGAQVKVDGNFILVSGDVRTTGVSFIAASGNINTGFFTGNMILSGGGNSIVLTGQTSFIHISGNTGAYAGFLTPTSPLGISSIISTGYFPSGLISGNVVLSGAGNTVVYTGVNSGIILSGLNVGISKLIATGTFNTGYFTGDLMLSGSGNVIVSTGTPINNLIVISGDTGSFTNFVPTSQTGQLATTTNLQNTGVNLQNQLNRPTGTICMFDSGIQTGVLIQSFQFPVLFNSPPFAFTQLKYLGNTGSGLPVIAISGITASGFSGVYNDTFQTTGYYLNILAMSGVVDTSYSNLNVLTNWWNNNPDRPPDNPSNYDDEFGYTGTLPGGNSGKWLWANQGTSTAIITGNHLRLTDSSAGNDNAAIYQPISGTSTTGNPWAITTKISLNNLSYSTFNKGGFFLSGSGSRIMVLSYRTNASNSVAQTLTYSLYTNATTFSSETLTTFMAWDRDIYLRVLNTGGGGTDLFFQYSRDGYSYITASSGSSTSFISEGILNVGLTAEAAGSTTFFDFDYFRLQTGIYM